MIEKTGLVVLTSAFPIFELRGGIPLALSMGFNPIYSLILTVSVNILVFFPVFFGLKIFYERWFSEIRVVNRVIDRIRKKGSKYVERYGLIGLAIFVAIPLPMSGVYSGAILSWLLGFEWKKSFISISLGALIAGIIVLLTTMGSIEALSWVLK